MFKEANVIHRVEMRDEYQDPFLGGHLIMDEKARVDRLADWEWEYYQKNILPMGYIILK